MILLLNHLKYHGGPVVGIFVDDKKFAIDVVSICRKRFIAKDSTCVSLVMQTIHLASVMVFGAVASDEQVIPLHFIVPGLKINTEDYLRIMRENLLCWILKKGSHESNVHPGLCTCSWVKNSADIFQDTVRYHLLCSLMFCHLIYQIESLGLLVMRICSESLWCLIQYQCGKITAICMV